MRKPPSSTLDHLDAISRLHHNLLLAIKALRHEGTLGVPRALVVRAPIY